MDRADERLKDESGLAGSVRAFIDRVRSGDLGSLPVIVGLIVISIIFQSINPVFLSANNLVNILFDCSTIGVISLGIVCILMLGEIDLSVGSVSGFASALLGVLWVQQGWPLAGAILAALAVGAFIGSVYAFLLQPLRHAELRLDPGGTARRAWTAALHSGKHRLDQPAFRLCPGAVSGRSW